MIKQGPAGSINSLKWILVFMLIGTLLVVPHLFDAVWQDESYTLLNFSSRGFFYPFKDYHLPNNHVLLSAMLSTWWSPGDSIIELRFPFLLVFIVSLGLLAWTTRMMAGNLAAVLAVVFFSFSTVTGNFALQLRGYGVSWLFVILVLSFLPSVCRGGNVLFALIYGLSGAILLAIVPTNLITYLVLMLWGVWFLLDQPLLFRQKLARILILGTPFLGLVVYIEIWPQILAASNRGFSEWSKADALWEFYKSYIADFLVFLPLAAAGILLWFFGKSSDKKNPYRMRTMLMAIASVPIAFLIVLKNAPFPRNFIPLIPLLSLVMAISVAHALDYLKSKDWVRPMPAIIILTTLCLTLKMNGWGCEKFAKLESVSNVCRTYYQHDYQPERVAAFLANRPQASSLVLTDFEGLYALMFLNVSLGLGLDLAHYKTYRIPDISNVSTDTLPWIVLGGGTASPMQLTMGPRQIAYTMLLDSGYFRVYGPVSR
jgi:hypothetical protein